MAVMEHGCALRAILACWLVACGGEPDDPSSADAGVLADGGDDFRGCAEGIPSFAPGLQTIGEHLAAKVVTAVPDEPERYLNSWTVELRAPDGAPAPDAQIVRAETFMPIHGHDGRVQPRMTALPEPGQVRVDRLNFTMRGPWQVRLWLRSAALQDDRVVFDVCVAK